MESNDDCKSIQNELLHLSEKRQRWVDANEENEFGEGIRNLLTELYPDNAHFIYELLQNAEDKDASSVTFRLLNDRLVFEHNGKRQFNHENVDAITSIGGSTSRNDPTAIGKFGVGFKAVFAYTEAPEIHSGEYHFRIRDLVVPDSTDVERLPIGEKTLFVFPFNHPKKSKQQAVSDIQRGLLDLSDNTLLFLRNIDTLHFSLPDGGEGYLKRFQHENGRVEIQSCRPYDSDSGEGDDDSALPLKKDQIRRSDWLRFEKTVQVIDPEDNCEAKSCGVAIAFQLEKREVKPKKPSQASSQKSRNPIWRIAPLEAGEVSIFFPAAKETSKLLFHMHAPFASTVARDSVRDCEVNDELRDHLASLVAESLTVIRDAGLLTVDFLGVLPIPNDHLSPFYSPFRERVVEEFASKALTPTKSGTHKRALILRRGANELTSRLGDRELAYLSEREFLRWAANPNQRNSREDQFLASIGVAEWGFEDLNDAATECDHSIVSEWLKAKPDDWVEQLYVALNRQRDYRAREASKSYPIVRLVDGTQVSTSTERLFLSQGKQTDQEVNVVSPSVVRNEDAKAFLTSLGIREFDLVASVKEFVLPKYSKPTPNLSFDEHKSDVQQILAVSTSVTRELRDAKFVLCTNVASGANKYKLGRECYFESEVLKCYFDGNPDAWFVSSKYDDVMNDEIRALFISIGVGTEEPRRSNTDQYKIKASYKGDDHERGLHGFNPRWNIVGLRHALSHPNVERSAYIWNTLLADSTHLISGVVEKCPVESFPSHRVEREQRDSNAGTQLKSFAWIPDPSGEFKKPHEVGDVESLHESLVPDNEILTALDEGAADTKRAVLDAYGIAVEKLGELQELEEQRREFEEFLEHSAGATPRRRAKIATRSLQSRRRTRATRERKVRVNKISSDEVFRYLEGFYRYDDRWRCQICRYPMPFQKRNKEEYCEKHELLSGTWAAKRGYSLSLPPNDDGDEEIVPLPEEPMLHIAVCPTCNRLFQEYVAAVDDEQDRLLKWVLEEESSQYEIRCSVLNANEIDRCVQFHQKHIDDIREVVSANLVQDDVANDTTSSDHPSSE